MGLKVVMIGAYPLEPGMIHGGIESVTSTLVPALAEQDDVESVTVLRFHHGEATTDYRREGPKVEVHYLRGQDRLRTITGSFMDVRKVRKLVRELEPDVVHGQEIGWFGDIAAKCSKNCVVTVHGLPHVEIRLAAKNSFKDKLRARPIDAMVKRVLRRAKVVISISKYDLDELTGLVRGSRVSIANPTAREFFDLAPSGPSNPQLLFAGVLTPRKNPIGLLDAFAVAHAKVSGSRLVLVGPHPDAEYADKVRAHIGELGLDDAVDVVGMVENDQLRAEIAKTRAVVLFSREETAPTIIAQAMAAGKTVVASRVGGIAEMVSDGESGYIVESEDTAALADRLISVLEDEDLCLRMGKRGHELALSRFEPDAVARRTVDAYKSALNS